MNGKPEMKGLLTQARGRIDLVLLLAIALVSAYGTVMVFSAGEAYAYARYGDSLYFVKKQTLWLLVGAAVMLLGSHINVETYRKYSPHFYAVTVILLVLVLLVGFVGNGAQRWISIGPLTIQPSEIGKLSLIMMLARYFSDFEERACQKKSGRTALVYGTLIPSAIMLLPIILVMLQKHLSCIIILGAIGLLLIFSAGVNPKYISIFCLLAICGVTYLAFFTDYTKDRITVWQDPEAKSCLRNQNEVLTRRWVLIFCEKLKSTKNTRS